MAEAYLNKIGLELHSDIRDYNNEELFKEYKVRLTTETPFYICRRACGKTGGKHSQWKKEEQLNKNYHKKPSISNTSSKTNFG